MAVCALLVVILLKFAWLGYLGGDLFTPMRPFHYQPRPGAPVAILWSGDMGFRVGMGPRVAARLVTDGVPVVGVNSLSYFRKTRTAADATALLEKAIGQAHAINPQARLLLIGQSYGADMLHVALDGLPRADRASVGLVALVVPGATVEYRASPAEIFTFAMAESDALPTARQLTWTPLLCIQGREETASLCPLLHQRNAEAVALPGGHRLNSDVDAVYGTLRAAMMRAHLAGRA
ncbi:AcvB/VirJ family lysyl-phosphatidylglycerol hydrolase [Sphingobium sp. CR2-8]|nr:AcvB/VirJ family lysyl-phosphatidylglycerol hydrolase [Sphingobium sp. CR2-8]MEC3912420.1 AcvB/VirJ family lysyl-phosphatidylglycerol hydrolase [Sphingobium sp. CR2-8]